MRTLGELAGKTPGVALQQADIASLALAQGFGHASAHSIVFCWSWLPLALGKGVLYNDRYRRMPRCYCRGLPSQLRYH